MLKQLQHDSARFILYNMINKGKEPSSPLCLCLFAALREMQKENETFYNSIKQKIYKNNSANSF